MTPDQQKLLLTAKFSDLPKLFPDYPMETLRKRRKALQSAVSQKDYRKRSGGRSYLSDTTPIGHCPEQEKLNRNAIEGSARLLEALRRAT